MKIQLHYYLVLALLLLFSTYSKAQYVAIPDTSFRAFLELNYPSCMQDGMLDTTCNEVVNTNKMFIQSEFIADVSGLEYLDKLDTPDITCLPLTSISRFPPSLRLLTIFAREITSLPPFPDSLKYLGLMEVNKMGSLPDLPEGLLFFYLYFSDLTSLPKLPSTIQRLTCYNNQLTSLPALPADLLILDCPNNQLTSLPALPAGLYDINCSYNQLESLPELSHGDLMRLDCRYNKLKCLPFISQMLRIIYVEGNQIACLPNDPGPFLDIDIEKKVCNASDNPNGCELYPLLSGKLYIDANMNDIMDANELTYGNAEILICPGDMKDLTDINDCIILIADSGGNYSVNLEPDKKYTMDISADHQIYSWYYEEIFMPEMGQILNYNYPLVFAEADREAQIFITPFGRIRAGRPTGYNITYRNKGSEVSDGIIELVYGDGLNLESSNPVAAGHENKILRWNYEGLLPEESRSITVYFKPATTTASGAEFTYTANIISDIDQQTFSDVLVHTVTGSYDPNLKEVSPASSLTPEQIAEQQPLTYTIYFQNTGNDTAFVIRVRDTISTRFAPGTMEVLAASHPYTFEFNDNVAVWTFDEILLPDSTTDEPGSHGFIKYRIKPQSTLQLGEELRNTAYIYFDFNAPIVTNTTVNTVEVPLGLSGAFDEGAISIYPNPAGDQVTISGMYQSFDSIKLMGTDGRVVYSRENVSGADLNINLEGVQKGIYYIQLSSGEDFVVRKLIVN